MAQIKKIERSDKDLGFCNGILEEIRDGINPNRENLMKANDLWRKYA